MELWDLYDIDLHKTGETHERGKPVPEDRYHMVVHMVIFSTDGKMLIQQRTDDKEGWPGLWDVTVGGSAVAGDDSRSAAQREVMEEIGLPLDLTGITPRLILPFDCGFDDIYTLIMDVDLTALTLQESEVQAVRWATEDEILQMLEDGLFIPYHPSLISLLFALRDSRGAHVSKAGKAKEK